MIKQAILRSATFAFGLLLFLSLAPTIAIQAQQTTPGQQPPTTYTRPTSMTRPAPIAGTQPGIATPAPDIAPPTNESTASRVQGVLIETLDGQKVMEQGANLAFNPASGVKLATALNALRNWGANHRFSTGVWTNGTLNTETGTLTGDLIISGRDPSLHY